MEEEEWLQSVLEDVVLAEARQLGPVQAQLCEKATDPRDQMDELVAHSVVNTI